MYTPLAGLCFPEDHDTAILLLNQLIRDKKPGYALLYSEDVGIHDLLISKEIDTVDLYSQEQASLCMLHSDFISPRVHEKIEENKEFVSFILNSAEGLHIFRRQGDRNRISELTIQDFGTHLLCNGDNFLNVEPHEQILPDVFSRALFPYLQKKFSDLDESAVIKRYRITLQPPDSPAPPPAQDSKSSGSDSSIQLKKNHYVHNVSIGLRLTIVSNYFQAADIPINTTLSESLLRTSHYWTQWEMETCEQEDFKFKMLLLAGTFVGDTRLSDICTYLSLGPSEKTIYSVIEKFNLISQENTQLQQVEYNPETKLLHFTIGHDIGQWSGELSSVQSLQSLLSSIGQLISRSGNQDFYFVPYYDGGLLLRLTPTQVEQVKNNFLHQKEIIALS